MHNHAFLILFCACFSGFYYGNQYSDQFLTVRIYAIILQPVNVLAFIEQFKPVFSLTCLFE